MIARRSSRRPPKTWILSPEEAGPSLSTLELYASNHVFSPNIIAKREGANPTGGLSIGLVA